MSAPQIAAMLEAAEAELRRLLAKLEALQAKGDEKGAKQLEGPRQVLELRIAGYRRRLGLPPAAPPAVG